VGCEVIPAYGGEGQSSLVPNAMSRLSRRAGINY
jgi:hypothetical protein